jgi:hypothetical protein
MGANSLGPRTVARLDHPQVRPCLPPRIPGPVGSSSTAPVTPLVLLETKTRHDIICIGICVL